MDLADPRGEKRVSNGGRTLKRAWTCVVEIARWGKGVLAPIRSIRSIRAADLLSHKPGGAKSVPLGKRLPEDFDGNTRAFQSTDRCVA